ncbi:ABC transporter ATP-binding protein [Candidatus Saccharibacteria bacterium]|nr:ABC transporter ATP-binding protein [Candidatus Saccharibacteria bacterium]
MPLRPATEKPKNASATAIRLLKDLRKWRVIIIFAIIASILSTLLFVLGPKVLGDITTTAVTSVTTTGAVDWDKILLLLITLIALYAVSGLLGYFESYLVGRLAAKYAETTRLRLLEKINHLPVSYFDKHQHGDLISIVSNDVDAITQSLQTTLTELISNIILFFGTLLMMIFISPLLTIVAAITIPISSLLVGKVARLSQKFYTKQRKNLGELNSIIEEDYSGQLIIKSNSHIPESYRNFTRVNDKFTESDWKAQFFGSVAFPITHIFTNLSYIGVCVFGGHLAITGQIMIGDVQAFIQYTNQFNRPITQVAQIFSTIQLTLAAAERVFKFLDEPEEPATALPESVTGLNRQTAITKLTENFRSRVKGAVEFHDLSFSYDKTKPTITNFSCKIEPGMQVALVGPTGAGKTTIVNLLMRFYDPDSGYITIDGRPTRELPRETVRNLFGMVLQDTWLFSGTIEENLRYGKPKATHEDIVSICKKAHIDHFITSLPDGYNTKISEDSDNISAGEKQLLTIARAMVENPPMMILDEATSNVDTRTEQLIQDAITKLTRGRTSFVIAHRLSTIRNADLILVMRDGNIVEQGNHETLLKQNGFYAELYNSQFQET